MRTVFNTLALWLLALTSVGQDLVGDVSSENRDEIVELFTDGAPLYIEGQFETIMAPVPAVSVRDITNKNGVFRVAVGGEMIGKVYTLKKRCPSSIELCRWEVYFDADDEASYYWYEGPLIPPLEPEMLRLNAIDADSHNQ